MTVSGYTSSVPSAEASKKEIKDILMAYVLLRQCSSETQQLPCANSVYG